MDEIVDKYRKHCEKHFTEHVFLIIRINTKENRLESVGNQYESDDRFDVECDGSMEYIRSIIQRLSEVPFTFVRISSRKKNKFGYPELIRDIIDQLPNSVKTLQIDCFIRIKDIGVDFLAEYIKYSSVTWFENMVRKYEDSMGGSEQLMDHEENNIIFDLMHTPLDERPIRSKTKSAMKR